MKRFCVIAMQERKEIAAAAYEMEAYLKERGCACCVNVGYARKEEVPDQVECVIVLGGDGTLLQAARELVETGIPLIGINFGNLGFLAEVEKEDIPKTLDRLMEDRFFVEQRMLLEGKIIRDEKVIAHDVALNDIVINRSSLMRVMHLKIGVNGQRLNEYQADGIILSTPTGSTAYSMSAGGPIVKPTAQLILMTPICPHTLNTRSIILDPEDVIDIQATSRRHYEDDVKKVYFDGDDAVEFKDGDILEIRRSKLSANIIRMGSRSFLEVLRKKMAT